MRLCDSEQNQIQVKRPPAAAIMIWGSTAAVLSMSAADLMRLIPLNPPLSRRFTAISDFAEPEFPNSDLGRTA